MALVSIIVPVHGTEKFLPRCLDSLLAQDMDDYEIIIVNDFSPDNSRSIISAYAAGDSRITLLENPENLGLHETRKRGAAAAQGKYITECDSDDAMPATALSGLVATAEQTGADIVHGRARALAEYGAGQHLWITDPFRIPTGNDYILAMLGNLRGWHLWGKLYRRETWDRAVAQLPENRGLFLAEDLLLSCMLGLEGRRYAASKSIAYHYRLPGGNYLADSTRGLRAVDDYMTVLTLLHHRLDNYGGDVRLSAGVTRITRHFLAVIARDLPHNLHAAAAQRIGHSLGDAYAQVFIYAQKRSLSPMQVAMTVGGEALRLFRQGGIRETHIAVRRFLSAVHRHGWHWLERF